MLCRERHGLCLLRKVQGGDILRLYELTAHELSELLRKREISSRDIVDDIYDRIEDVEEKVRAYITLTKEEALKQAEEADRRLKENDNVGPLTGIPIAVKDNMCTKGVKTTCASKMLENFIPPYDATVIEKIRQTGMVMLGKTNMDEFAMGSSTENSRFFETRNPWDIERVPGGSSGGSAAAVASGEAVLALGSDTGGSIRQPASLCGIVGMKPTYGRVSRYGLISYASSFDQIGTFSRDVRDCALFLSAISGYDPKDSTSANVEVPDYAGSLTGDIKGIKVGLPKEYFGEGLDGSIREAVMNAVKVMEGLGAEIVEVSLPHAEYAIATYYLVATAEASSNLARFDGVKYGHSHMGAATVEEMSKLSRQEGFGKEVKRRIMLGTYALSAGYYDAYYLKALKVRTLIRDDFDKAFEKCDALISPTSPSVAFRFGEKTENLLEMYMNDIFTVMLNLAGIPGISVPCGLVREMPVGIQFIGKAFDEARLLNLAYAYERNNGLDMTRPVTPGVKK